jgi:hypothetical protein
MPSEMSDLSQVLPPFLVEYIKPASFFVPPQINPSEALNQKLLFMLLDTGELMTSNGITELLFLHENCKKTLKTMSLKYL